MFIPGPFRSGARAPGMRPALGARGWACVLVAGAGAVLATGPAFGERADRSRPMVIEAEREGTIDAARGVTVFSGNAVITQGTMQIRADRIEVRNPPQGPRTAQALGSAAQPASFRQKREGVDEQVEAQAERIDYDGATETLKLSGGAVLRRLRGATVVDEAQGATMVWNARSETLTMQGGAPSPANPAGRVRATLSPAPASAPSAPSVPSLPSATGPRAAASASAAAPARPALERK